MFLQVCVILFTGRGEYLTRYTPPGPGTPPRTRYTPRTRHTPLDQAHPPGPGTPPPGPGRYGLRAGGTHPTGMHSCLYFELDYSFNESDEKK